MSYTSTKCLQCCQVNFPKIPNSKNASILHAPPPPSPYIYICNILISFIQSSFEKWNIGIHA